MRMRIRHVVDLWYAVFTFFTPDSCSRLFHSACYWHPISNIHNVDSYIRLQNRPSLKIEFLSARIIDGCDWHSSTASGPLSCTSLNGLKACVARATRENWTDLIFRSRILVSWEDHSYRPSMVGSIRKFIAFFSLFKRQEAIFYLSPWRMIKW
jgi:hypothetical protein